MRLIVLIMSFWCLATTAYGGGAPLFPETEGEVLCRRVVDGSACHAIDHGVLEPRTGALWRRASTQETGDMARSRCAIAFGEGWRLPTLKDVYRAQKAKVFGYCSFRAWVANPSSRRGASWVHSIYFSGRLRCEGDRNMGRRCDYVCASSTQVPELTRHDALRHVMCLRDNGD